MIKHLPKRIEERIQNQAYQTIDLGMSGASVFLFDDQVLKTDQVSFEMLHELQVLRTLESFHLTPKLIEAVQKDDMVYLLMERLKGSDLSQKEHIENPIRLIDLLIEGLHTLWDIPISHLDLKYTLEDKLHEAKIRIDHGFVDFKACDEGIIKKRFKDETELYQYLVKHKPVLDDIVLSHGDYCLPNIFADQHTLIGFIDLGRVGLDSKHQDVALCARSLLYNLEDESYVKLFYEKLGIPIDERLIDYYLLLDELF